MVVTGGGRGIGAATSRLAAQRGYTVCVNYLRNRDAAGHSARNRKLGRQREGCAATSQANPTSRLGEAAKLALIRALVATPVSSKGRRLDDMQRRAERVFAINITGAFLCARAVRRMSTRHGGTGGAIVNVSSMASRLGSPGEYVDYAASKGAIDSLTIGLAKEVAAEGIRVNAVRPGVIYTEIHASGGEPGRVDRVKSAVPMQRGGQPDEVARAILWLCSDESSYSTGTFIDVSGGR